MIEELEAIHQQLLAEGDLSAAEHVAQAIWLLSQPAIPSED